MELTAWIIVWYSESGIQIQSTREVSRSAYCGHTIVGLSSIRIVARTSLKEICMTWLANPAKITHRLRIKIPTAM
jgi:hypothetical protein